MCLLIFKRITRENLLLILASFWTGGLLKSIIPDESRPLLEAMLQYASPKHIGDITISLIVRYWLTMALTVTGNWGSIPEKRLEKWPLFLRKSSRREIYRLGNARCSDKTYCFVGFILQKRNEKEVKRPTRNNWRESFGASSRGNTNSRSVC